MLSLDSSMSPAQSVDQHAAGLKFHLVRLQTVSAMTSSPLAAAASM